MAWRAAEERVPHVAGQQTVTESKYFWPTSSRSVKTRTRSPQGVIVALADYEEIFRGLGDKQAGEGTTRLTSAARFSGRGVAATQRNAVRRALESGIHRSTFRLYK
jgi:hypothetical protein